MKIVLDTCVVVAAFRSRTGASNKILRYIAPGKFRPLVTTALFLEYEDVLHRAEHHLASGMSEVDVRGALAALASACDPVELHFRWRPQLSDPSDEMVLEAAANGGAQKLITHNVRDFAGVSKLFDLQVVTPQQFLEEFQS